MLGSYITPHPLDKALELLEKQASSQAPVSMGTFSQSLTAIVIAMKRQEQRSAMLERRLAQDRNARARTRFRPTATDKEQT